MRRAAALLALLPLLASGCFYHSARIELAPSSDEPAALTEAEVARATEIVARTVTARGLVVDPQAVEIKRLSREEAEWDHYILAAYSAGPDAATGNEGVVVSVLQDKKTGRYSVVVRDLAYPFSTDFTTSLEQSLTEALTTAFPSRSIRVGRETVGPALGP